MKKYILSAIFSASFILMMIAGGTADGHFTAGLILAAVALCLLGLVALLCRLWAKDFRDLDED